MSTKKLTPWFPPEVKPVREGVYIATVVREETFYRYWDGRLWLTGDNTVKGAYREAGEGIPTWHQSIHWRGLAKAPA